MYTNLIKKTLGNSVQLTILMRRIFHLQLLLFAIFLDLLGEMKEWSAK